MSADYDPTPDEILHEDSDADPATDADPGAQTTNRWREWASERGWGDGTAFRARDRAEVRRQMQRDPAPDEDPVPPPAAVLEMSDITLDDYQAMLHQQGGGCASCGDQPAGLLCLDFRDDGPGVYGLLCEWCHEVVRTVDPERAVAIVAYMIRRRIRA